MKNEKESKERGMGENLEREWDAEPHAGVLWDALEMAENDISAALEMMEDLAEKGSALAMMYLGNSYNFGNYGLEPNQELADSWLRRSARLGSIEGSFEFARRKEIEGDYELAEIEFRRLADRQFPPALYVLGRQHRHGGWLKQDTEKSIEFLEKAEKLGHFHAQHMLRYIHTHEKSGVANKVRGWVKFATMLIPFLRYSVNYPNSDRLRM